MKLLVLSDSHGDVAGLRKAIDNHKDADAVIFLGDGLRDMERAGEFLEIPLVMLCGNCDTFASGSGAIGETVLDFDGVRALCCHGHRYGVKSSLGNIVYAAMEKEASLVLYGHTHVPLETKYGKITLFCPGSVREGKYGIVYIQKGVVLTSHGRL